jgi:hypothetical protein
VIYSGLDWSGDIGDPARTDLFPWLPFAIVHVDGTDLRGLAEALNRVRQQRNLSGTHVF